MLSNTIMEFEQELNKSLKRILDSKSLPLYDMMAFHFGLHGNDTGIIPDRFYGKLLKISHDAIKKSDADISTIALSLEMINAFLEIHDDIESGNPKRKNTDALWWIWGPAQAINAGNAMHAFARLIVFDLEDHGYSSDLAYKSIDWVDHACLKSLEGRYRDLHMQEGLITSIDAYTLMAGDKSGALIGASLAISGLLAGKNKTQQNLLFQSGIDIGIAQQIKMDIDQLWPKNDSNKSIEFLNKKKLFPVVAALDVASASEKRILGEVYFKRVLESKDILTVQNVVEKLGAKQSSLDSFAKFKNQSYEKINEVIDFKESDLQIYLDKFMDPQ